MIALPSFRSAATSTLVLGLIVAGTPAATAAPEPVQPVGADGQVVIDGTGFGHGRGMSQWGAYGAADAGVAWRDILGFYYPGATQATQSNSQMRIWISRDSDGITEVPAQARLRAVVGRTVLTLPTGSRYTAWRVVRSGSLVALQYRDAAGVWRGHRIPRTQAVVFLAGDTVQVTMPGGRREEFPGRVVARLQGTKVTTTVYTTMERYLRGVVPNEMPALWHSDALAAQTVAARTYASAYRARQRAKGSPWDVCDTIVCQVYRGAASVSANGLSRTVLDHPRTNAAIAATSGTVLKTPRGNYVFTEFSASNGGQTVDGGAFSQVAKADPYDGRLKDQSWTKPLTAAAIARTFGVGTLKSVQVLDRDGLGPLGGRVTSVRLVGTTRTVDVTGARMRQAFGLRSDRFTVRTPVTRPTTAGGIAASSGDASVTTQWVGNSTPDRLSVSGGRLVVAPGAPGGRLGATARVFGSPTTLRTLVGAADVDGDRKTDLIAVDSRNRLVVMRGNGRGAVLATKTLGQGWGAFRSLALKDVSGDGRADVLATRRDGVRILYTGTAAGSVRKVGVYSGR